MRESKNIARRLKQVILWAGEISYAIFLVHYGICYLLKIYRPGAGYMMVTAYIVLVILGGILLNSIITAMHVVLNARHIEKK